MKFVRSLVYLLLCTWSVFPAFSQSTDNLSDPIFSINERPVSLDEFVYLYRKNHQHKPEEFTRKKIDDYLDLYIRYKLKVTEAMDRGMDTTASFKREFQTYREELLKPRLGDGALVDSLARMTYDRLKEEIRAAHILVQLPPNPQPSDTLAAWNKIVEIRTRALAGEDFAELARQHSEEPGAASRGGDLGYFTAMQMVFPFEQAAYGTPVGSISMPVRTRFGYHVLKVLDRRPSRGEVEVSHIMIRTAGEEDDAEARDRIFTIHEQVQKGADWNEICSEYSDDANTKDSGGRLRPFGSGAMNAAPDFEEMAFSLQSPGDISDPVRTPFGWHILRLEARTPLPPFEELKTSLIQRIRRDDRLRVAVDAQRRNLLAELGYEERAATISALLNTAAAGPAADPVSDDAVLFVLAGNPYRVSDLTAFVQNESGGLYSREKFDAFVEKSLYDALEKRIMAESSDYKWLLQEYYEGILLFEIMEKEVWNKAVQDTAGQRRYFERHASKYRADERITGTIYSGTSKVSIGRLEQLLQRGEPVQQFIAENAIRVDSGTFERNDRMILASIPWAPGLHKGLHNGLHYLIDVKEMVPPGRQNFSEAQPAVISDYQTKLEDEWIQELKRKFAVRVDRKVKKRALNYLLNP